LILSSGVVFADLQGCGSIKRQTVTGCTINDCSPINGGTETLFCYLINGECKAYGLAENSCVNKIDPYLGEAICQFIPGRAQVWLPCSGGGSGGNYEYTRCPEGQVLSCGTVAEAGSQNKKFCGYKITCNKYYWPSAFNQPEPCNVNNVASTTCTYNCSCCPIGQYRSCTLGASYTNTVSLYVGGGGDPVDSVYNQMLKDTCYRDGVKRRNDIVVSITLKRSYTKKDNTEWQDWEQSCRVQNCSCKAPPTPTLTPSKSACASGVRMT